MNYQFDDLLGRFYYKNQCNIIIATGQTSHPAGEAKKPHLRVEFDRRLKLEFHGSKIMTDAGLPAYCELAEVLGLTNLGEAALSDLRRAKKNAPLADGLVAPIDVWTPGRIRGRMPTGLPLSASVRSHLGNPG